MQTNRMNGQSFTNTRFNMKKFPAIALLAVMAILPQQRAAAQDLEEDLVNFFATLLVDYLVSELGGEPAEQPAQKNANTISKSDIEGTWILNDRYMLLNEGSDGIGCYSLDFGTVLFSGEYRFNRGILTICDYNGTPVQTWHVVEASDKLVLRDPSGTTRVTGTYCCTTDAMFAKKQRSIDNLTANNARMEVQNNSYLLSRQIRNDINYSDTRRSYSHEAVQARENAKWYYGQGNTAQAKAWEQKAIELERDVQQLDRSHRN